MGRGSCLLASMLDHVCWLVKPMKLTVKRMRLQQGPTGMSVFILETKAQGNEIMDQMISRYAETPVMQGRIELRHDIFSS